jgi:hypothetical protein
MHGDILSPEDGGSIFFRNVGVYLYIHTASNANTDNIIAVGILSHTKQRVYEQNIRNARAY